MVISIVSDNKNNKKSQPVKKNSKVKKSRKVIHLVVYVRVRRKDGYKATSQKGHPTGRIEWTVLIQTSQVVLIQLGQMIGVLKTEGRTQNASGSTLTFILYTNREKMQP